MTKEEMNDVRYTSTLAKNNEAVLREARTSPESARAAELIDYIEQSTPPTYMDDVMLDRSDRELILTALRSFRVAQSSREHVIEECAKVAEQFHRWIGSADYANAFDKAGIATAIRSLSNTSTTQNSAEG